MLSAHELETLDEAGWLRIERALSPADVASTLSGCRDLLDEPDERRRRGDRPHSGTRHLMELDDRLEQLGSLLQSGPVVEAVTHLLGPDHRADQVSYRSPQPGHGGQSLHADDLPQLTPGPCQVATAVVALTEFTATNGATRVVPGSHRRIDLQRRSGSLSSHPDEVVLRCEAGDALVFSGHLLHSGTPNRSDAERPALQITWRR